MAFLENSFALLNDTEGDDAKLFVPVASKAEKNPGNKKNKNQHKPQSPSVAPNKSPTTPIPLHSGRCNGNGLARLDNLQNGTPQSNFGKSNGYRMYNGQVDGEPQYRGDRYVYWRDRQGNVYRKVNRHSDTRWQNNDGGYRHYRRGSGSAGYEQNGRKQRAWLQHGCDRRKEFNKINGSRNEDKVLEANQKVESQGQEKLAAGNFFKGDGHHQFRNGGWNFVGERRGNGAIEEPRGNRGRKNTFSSRFGGINKGKGEASVESVNGERGDNGDKNATNEGKETTEVSNDAEPRKRNHERVSTRYQSEVLIKEEKGVNIMTLEEYEKQLLVKRKALEALKQQERKVTLNKDFESIQLVGRKKEDFATKLNSEEDKLEEEESLEKDEKVQLKKERSPEQDEKLKKSMSIDLFLKVFKGSGHERGGYRRDFEREGGHGRGQGGELKEHGRYSGGYSRNGVDNGVEAAPGAGKSNGFPSQALKINIQDSEHFPCLGPVAKA